MTTLPNNFADYQQWVMSKAAPSRPIDSFQFNLLHSALGLASEVLELLIAETEDNICEEYQDILWYLTFSANLLDIDVSAAGPCVTLDIDECTEKYVSLVKKHVIYNKPRHTELAQALFDAWCAFLSEIEGVYSIEELIHKNRLKLDTRYAAGFTSEESEIRKDKDGSTSPTTTDND